MKFKSPLQKIEEIIKSFWRRRGSPSVIAAKHAEFVIEPRVFLGNKLNPEILKLLVANYLSVCSKQDSGIGNIALESDKLIIKSPKGKPLVIVRDQKLIQAYLAAKKQPV